MDIGSWDSAETANGSITAFTFAPDAGEIPLPPFTVQLFKGGLLIGNDDGKGGIQGRDADDTAVTGTVNYAAGAASVTFTTAPAAGQTVVLDGGIALEKDNNLEIIQSVDITLRAVPFTMHEYPITASFSKKLELTLGTSYKADAQEAYLRATLDIQAFTLASRQAHRNSAASPTVFNMQGAVGEAETNRIQAVSRYIDKVGTKIYSKLFRGGVSVIFGGLRLQAY